MYKAFVEFNLVAHCVHNCKYCPQGLHKSVYKGNKVMKFEDYCSMVDKLPTSCISIAGFCEPFSNPRCTDMIEYATKNKHMVIIYTSLAGMKPDDYDRLRKNYGVRGFTVHLPDNLKNSVFKITDEYREMLKYVIGHPMGGWCNFEYSVHGTQAASEITDILRLQNVVYRIHDRAGCLNVKEPSADIQQVHWKSGQMRCANGFGAYQESGLVLPDGTVVACCMDWGMKYKFGNLLTQTWDSVMQSPLRVTLAQSRLTGKPDTMCRHCAEATFTYRR